ncbi:MAG: hypothetical protein KC933_18240 [Myxococcales bacterium]|nr:hypothetical protein [Myxococcales bacterium]MCB9645964.1 hypothetical protein [Deltaproteobacteria bacterium]
MSTTRPSSLEEWAHYIAGLSGDDLRSKAHAINSIDFVDDLMDEGFDPDEVETLFILLAQHLERMGMMLPDAGLYSYRRMAKQTPPVQVSLPPPHAGVAVPDDVDALDDEG